MTTTTRATSSKKVGSPAASTKNNHRKAKKNNGSRASSSRARSSRASSSWASTGGEDLAWASDTVRAKTQQQAEAEPIKKFFVRVALDLKRSQVGPTGVTRVLQWQVSGRGVTPDALVIRYACPLQSHRGHGS